MGENNVVSLPTKPTRKVGHITRIAALGSTSLSTPEVFPDQDHIMSVEGDLLKNGKANLTWVESARGATSHMKGFVASLTGAHLENDSLFR